MVKYFIWMICPEDYKLEKNKKHSIEIVVDRLVMRKGIESRLADSLETCLNLSNGLALIDDETDIDACRCPTEIHRRHFVDCALLKCNLVHARRVIHGILWCSANKLHDRGRRRHGETANSVSLGDTGVADVGVGVVRAVAREIQPVDDCGRPCKPAIAERGDSDAKFRTVTGHGIDDRRMFDLSDRIHRRFGGRHRGGSGRSDRSSSKNRRRRLDPLSMRPF